MSLSKIVQARLEKEEFGYHSITIYGGAFHIAKNFEDNTYTLDQIISGIQDAITMAKFVAPDIKPSVVANTFCQLLFIDPMLIEAYLGFRFTNLNKTIQ